MATIPNVYWVEEFPIDLSKISKGLNIRTQLVAACFFANLMRKLLGYVLHIIFLLPYSNRRQGKKYLIFSLRVRMNETFLSMENRNV